MEWRPLQDQEKFIQGTVAIEFADLLEPFTGDVSRLRSLDNLGQFSTAAVNVLFVLAVLSVIPAVSHCISAYAGWSQPALATTWLLTQVLDPVSFIIASCRWRARTEQEKRAPVQKTRAVVVSLLFAAIVGIEVVFIVGQATRKKHVKLPLSQFRMALYRKANTLIEFRDLAVGTRGGLFGLTLLDIPGTMSQGRLVFSERKFSTVYLNRSETSAIFEVETESVSEARNAAPISLVVRPTAPLLDETPYSDFPQREYRLSILGLSEVDNFFVPFSWIDTEVIQSAVDVMAFATNSRECNWTASFNEERELFYVFTRVNPVEMCSNSMTAQIQHDIVLLLGRLLMSRIRVGSFVNPDDPKSLELVDQNGEALSAPLDFSPEYPLTGRLPTTRQVIPNTVLIGTACALILLAIGRSLCLEPDRRFVNRDYKIVAAALGWEKNSTFSRVNLDACQSSLASEDDPMRDARFHYSLHEHHGIAVPRAGTPG